MRFSTTKRVLSEALSITGRAVGGKNIIQILDYYKFVIQNDTLEITGSNMEMFIHTKIEIQSDITHLMICVPKERLISIIKDLPEQPLVFDINEKTLTPKPGETVGFKVRTLTLTAGKGVYSMTLEDAENFPEITNGGSEIQFAIPSEYLLKGIDRSLFAVMGENISSPLCSLYFSLTQSSAIYVGCNGHIMGNYTHPVDSPKAIDVLLPAKVVSILQTLPLDETLKVGIDSKSMKVQINDDTLMEFILVDEKYPDWRNVIPVNQDKIVGVDRNELIGAIKRVSNFSNQITHRVNLAITNNSLALTSSNEDFGEEGKEDLSCEYTGEDFTIGCNARNLLAALGKTTADNLLIHLSDFNRPILVREEKEFTDPKENILLVMPVV